MLIPLRLKSVPFEPYPGLVKAAERACVGLNVTPEQFIESLDPEYGYPEIVDDPKLARVYAKSISITKPWRR